MDLVLFPLFLVLGKLIDLGGGSDSWSRRIKPWSSATLLAFICLMFGEMGFPRDNLLLIGLGVALQAVPALIGMAIGNRGAGPAFLLFSTYGGGNRGTLAVTLLAPSLLPDFMLIDLGNLLSLILLFRLSARPYLAETGGRQRSARFLAATVAAILAGVALRHLAAAAAPLHGVALGVKSLLIALTSLQIGLALRVSRSSLRWVLAGLCRVRLTALVIPAAACLLLAGDRAGGILPLLGLFAILPVSSLAASLLPADIDDEIRHRLSDAMVGSTVVTVMVIALVAAGRLVWG